jgi:tRNA modification GTPase
MGGVGVVRLSGPAAFDIASRVFKGSRPLGPERALRRGAFTDPSSGEVIDQGLLLAMPAPGSYTAEDVVEFQAHGSPAVLARLVETLVSQGARPARPGEFTYRAFMNGRIDLAQAEAVQALVAAQGDTARREALRQLTGGLSSCLEPIEEALKALHLQVEARLEFPDEGLPPLDREAFERGVAEAGQEIVRLIESYRRGCVLSQGLRVAILGPPNAGKSSLLNALLGRERAIVMPHPGTTRDVVEGETFVKGVRVRLYDTAGLREGAQGAEEEGIRRSRQVLREADVVLWVVDVSDPGAGVQESYAADLPVDRTWYLFNKCDLLMDPASWKRDMGILPDGRCFAVSCKTGEGLQGVGEVLESSVGACLAGEDVILLSSRHRSEAEEAVLRLVRLGEAMQAGASLEVWAEELRAAARALGRIRGRDLPSETLDAIFETFCIGK